MPLRKKAAANSSRAAQGRPGRRKNISPEVVADTDSGDEFEHLTIEAEDSIDEIEVVEISDDETGDKEEPVPTPPPRTRRTAPKGTPSSPSPIKANGKKRNIVTPNQDAELTIIPSPTPNSPKKAISTPLKTTGKKRAVAATNSNDEDAYIPSPEQASPKKARAKEPSTPSKAKEPSTPSKTMKSGSKKRALVISDSDAEDVFIPSPVHDSPKKPRAKEPSTPSKTVKNNGRQLVFDKAVSDAAALASPFIPKVKIEKDSAKSVSSKSVPPKIDLTKKTVYLSDIEMEKISLPDLKKCLVFSKNLVDPILKETYKMLPKLLRMADFSNTWGPRSEQGGYMLSNIKSLYKSPDMNYLKALITFSHDKIGTIGNLSRIDPTLLGVKDANHFNKNMIHLHGSPSIPLLCFSVILTTGDNHINGRTFGPGNEWIVKDIAGVLPAMELERAVAVIGLAYKMPYVPQDSARTEFDVLHFTMFDNAFSFSTSMMKEADYKRDLATNNTTAAGPSSTSKRAIKKGLFAPASPALSNNVSSSAGIRKPSLRPPETVPIYDGRKHQLKVPDELRDVPSILPRYLEEIPNHSLVLAAYTVSLYRAAQGSRKNQPTVSLSIPFAVVLHEGGSGDGGEDQQEGGTAEEHDEEAKYQGAEEAEDQSAEAEDQSAEEAEDQSAEEAEDQSTEEAEDQSYESFDLSKTHSLSAQYLVNFLID